MSHAVHGNEVGQHVLDAVHGNEVGQRVSDAVSGNGVCENVSNAPEMLDASLSAVSMRSDHRRTVM